MSTPKPANQDLSQALSLFSSSQLETIYEQYMDAMLSSIGRDITIYMPPGQSAGTSNPSQFNPWTRVKDPRLGATDEGVAGVSVSPITVVYKAHIVHGPRMPTEHTPFTLDEGDVQLTTVIGSLLDIENAVEVEVDGIRFNQKKNDTRQIGLTTPKYLISVWTKKSEG